VLYSNRSLLGIIFNADNGAMLNPTVIPAIQVRAYHQAKLDLKHRSQQSFCLRLRGSSDCRALLSTLQDRGVGVSLIARVENISLFLHLGSTGTQKQKQRLTSVSVTQTHTDTLA